MGKGEAHSALAWNVSHQFLSGVYLSSFSCLLSICADVFAVRPLCCGALWIAQGFMAVAEEDSALQSFS